MVLCICLVLRMEAEGLKEIDRLNENIQEATKEEEMGNAFYTNIHLTKWFLPRLVVDNLCAYVCSAVFGLL